MSGSNKADHVLNFQEQIAEHTNSIELCRFRNKDSNAMEEDPSLIRAILELATVEQGVGKKSLSKIHVEFCIAGKETGVEL